MVAVSYADEKFEEDGDKDDSNTTKLRFRDSLLQMSTGQSGTDVEDGQLRSHKDGGSHSGSGGVDDGVAVGEQTG